METIYRLAFFVSGEGTNMAHIDDMCKLDKLPCKVCLVIADRICKGIERAMVRGIDVGVVRLGGIREQWNSTLKEYVNLYDIDLICLGGFMKILGQPLVEDYTNRIINIHPGTLPELAGRDPQKRAIEDKLKATGNTVHIITEKVDDCSCILAMDRVDIDKEDTEDSLSSKLKFKGYSTYYNAIIKWINLVERGELEVC